MKGFILAEPTLRQAYYFLQRLSEMRPMHKLAETWRRELAQVSGRLGIPSDPQ